MQTIITGLVAIFILFMGSIIFSNYYLSKKIALIESKLEHPQKEENLPRRQEITAPKILYNLAGLIQKLEENSLILQASIPKIDDAGHIFQDTNIRKVVVGPNTKFTRLAFVTQEGTDRRTPKETQIVFKDLKVNDYVEVVSNQDISQKQEFEATKIRILPKSF